MLGGCLAPGSVHPVLPGGRSFGTVSAAVLRVGADRGTLLGQLVDVPGPATEAWGEAARQANVYRARGVIERDTEFGGGTLYCTLLDFGPGGRLLGKHRKLKPTAAERLIWGEGDGSTLTVLQSELGALGGLIC